VNEFLAKFDGPHFIGLVAVAGGLLCGILCGVTAILAGCWQKVRRAEILAALKQDMLNRGMSAEEIWTVIEAGSRTSRKALKARFACMNQPTGV
jgi:hypothetical protein